IGERVGAVFVGDRGERATARGDLGVAHVFASRGVEHAAGNRARVARLCARRAEDEHAERESEDEEKRSRDATVAGGETWVHGVRVKRNDTPPAPSASLGSRS